MPIRLNVEDPQNKGPAVYIGDKLLKKVYVGTNTGPLEVWRSDRVWTQYTSTTSVSVPDWAAYVDFVVVGGGGGASGGNNSNSNGTGGSAGSWKTLMGRDIPPRTSIQLVVGTGGTGGAGGSAAAGSAGGESSIVVAGEVVGTAAGGAGGTGTANTSGKSPGSVTFTVPAGYGYGVTDSITFTGGAEQTSTEGAGNFPGGGGGPGKGAVFYGAKKGGDGAGGCAWIRFRSY